ncbi:GNAT family N-acetyltransferase, partial [Romboutsia sp. 13368]|uniref:GNAT family N-acetyltransferase n=1 Tax=Romboutsia sp. 13368 TaxID=2708053 RepID=UPI0025D62902
MNIRYAKEEEIENIKDIWNYCFNDEDSFVDYYFNNRYNNQNTIVACEDKDIVSSLQLNQYKIKLDNKIYDTSYVVGVSTFPEVRGRGYMKKIMDYSLNELYKKGQLISILMPIDYRLYRKYGYEHCYDQLEYYINIDDLKNFNLAGRLYKATEENIDDLININNTFLEDVNGNTVRDKEYYINLFKEVNSEGGHIYVYKDGTYKGYIIYFLNNENIFVRELFYKDLDSLKSILKFIYNHNTQCKKVTISAPVNDKIKFVLENPKDTEIKIKPFMMGRVINVEEYINGLEVDEYIDIDANIFIEDTFIKENNGVFNIKIKNKKVKAKKVNDDYSLY